MSEHDEWFPPVESQTDFATNTENGIEWSGQEQERRQYDVPSQLSVEWGSSEYIDMRAIPVEDYDGPYSAVPSWNDQTFATADRYMSDNFEVSSILELEVTNDAGGLTLTI